MLSAWRIACPRRWSPVGLAADPPKAKVTFQDHVSPVFRSRCGSCHNPDKQKGGLNLDNFGAAMQGGGSGKVVEPGDADNSTLLQVVTHKEEPKMPPNSPKIPDAEIEVIRKWIEGGALENSGSVAVGQGQAEVRVQARPRRDGQAGRHRRRCRRTSRPSRSSPRPSRTPSWRWPSSPWAPLVAVGGHKQVLLYRTTDRHLVGVLAVPRRDDLRPQVQPQRRPALAGGGRGGQSGMAVAWDVKNGHARLRGRQGIRRRPGRRHQPRPRPGRPRRPEQGRPRLQHGRRSLPYEMQKHTEWITAARVQPRRRPARDRRPQQRPDRLGSSDTGREFFDLRGHTGGDHRRLAGGSTPTSLASSSEDGTVKLWEMENGNQIKTCGAHGGGAASVRFAKDGRLVTTGRDRVVRLWDQNGGKQRDFEAFGDLALEAVFTHDEPA